MNRTLGVPVAASVGVVCLLALDGWFPAGSVPRGGPVPRALSRSFDRATADLQARAADLERRPEITRSLLGGGIAVNRLALFSAARQALQGAAAGSWIALTDPAGHVQAWWGDAPSSLSAPADEDEVAARWSATRLTLRYRRSLSGGRAGFVYVARTLPVEAPEFGRALGLSGADLAWEPIAQGGGVLLKNSAGRQLVGARSVDYLGRIRPWRSVALAAALASMLLLVGRARVPLRIGMALATGFLAVEGWTSPGHVLASPRLLLLAGGFAIVPWAATAFADGPSARLPKGQRLAAAYGLLAAALWSSAAVPTPDLGEPFGGSPSSLLRLAGLTALVASALALASSRRTAARWKGLTAAMLATPLAIGVALAFLSTSPAFAVILLVATAGLFELWARSIGAFVSAEGIAVPRWLTGTALLTVLIVSPLSEHRRAVSNLATAREIRLPDPNLASGNAVFSAGREVDRIRQLDLGRELPAPIDRTDLSDLAYRIWRDGESRSRSASLIAYEVHDTAGTVRSRFSLIPGFDTGTRPPAGPVRIDRHEVAVVRRSAPLLADGRAWGLATVAVADWPVWDPLPPRIAVYRRLVAGERAPSGLGPARPLVASYARDGENRDEGPPLPSGLRGRLRTVARPIPIHTTYRGQDLWGEVRPVPEGYQLVAVPGPDFLGRLLTAALLIPGIALLPVLGGILALWRIAATPRERRSEILPPTARTFRGRLVALFVVGVLIPLFAVTFFFRSAILTRSQRDTLDHARTALETARRVLDDYLPSERGRLGSLDDALMSWLAGSVGYDLSVYAPDSILVATSRRDLYSAGLLTDRAPAVGYVAIGLAGAAEHVGSRVVSGSEFEEITTALAAVPGVPGVRSPGLLSLLLLPQQRIAQAEAMQLTAAVSAFSLLVFLLSALIASRWPTSSKERAQWLGATSRSSCPSRPTKS